MSRPIKAILDAAIEEIRTEYGLKINCVNVLWVNARAVDGADVSMISRIDIDGSMVNDNSN